MNSLYVFNPETDYALASDREYYTAPASIIELRKKEALLPAIYAQLGDAILLLDDPMGSIHELKYYNYIQEKGLKIISLSTAIDYYETLKNYEVRPWGWNKNIRRILLDQIGYLKNIPGYKTIETIRELSHRRLTIQFLKEMQVIISNEIEIPMEIFDINIALEIFKSNKYLFYKAPWSSSGRGILLTDDLDIKHVEPWVKGIIQKQGSVMVEKAYDKKLDFASEWFINDDGVKFLGFSVFNTSRRGKYHSNIYGSQEELKSIIEFNSKQNINEIIKYQQIILQKIIAPHYNGPLGIDMLVTSLGNINPCLEVNLRYTMGMINLL